MAQAYIGLGSNMGKRSSHLRQAIVMLEETAGIVLKISSVYRTKPVSDIAQDDYLNAVVCIKTELEPLELLRVMQKIETDSGRERLHINGPRTLDLDLLLYDDIVMETDEITIPHPRMSSRSFVLTPLYELAPELHLEGRLIGQILKELFEQRVELTDLVL